MLQTDAGKLAEQNNTKQRTKNIYIATMKDGRKLVILIKKNPPFLGQVAYPYGIIKLILTPLQTDTYIYLVNIRVDERF